ncbi:methyltransferase [Infirmifilum uzonense]|nr:methyltransferase [Infirmifilum uzonense]
MPTPASTIRESLFTLITKTLLRLYTRRSRRLLFHGAEIMAPKTCFPPIHTISTEALLKVLGGLAGFKRVVVEIGCGPGSLLIAMALSSDTEYFIGTDISDECIKAARVNSILNRVYSKTDFIVCDSGSCIRDNSAELCYTNPPFLPYDLRDQLDLPFAGGRDLKTAIRMIRDCFRVSKRGGLVFYTLSDLSTGLRLKARGRIILEASGLGDRVYVFASRR